MNPNKFLTSGSPLQIPLTALQRPPSASPDAPLNGGAQRLSSEPSKHVQAEDSTLAPRGSALELGDFATEHLSTQQVTVLRAIASGKDIVAAAREAGVARCTIYRWRQDPDFQKCLRAWQSQTKESGHNIMLTLIERSVRIVERALDNDDASPEFHRRVRVAITLLSKLGVLTANEGPKGLFPIPGEGTINEPEMTKGDVGSSRRG